MAITVQEIRETALALIEARSKVNKEIMTGYLLAVYDCGIISYDEYKDYIQQYGIHYERTSR